MLGITFRPIKATGSVPSYRGGFQLYISTSPGRQSPQTPKRYLPTLTILGVEGEMMRLSPSVIWLSAPSTAKPLPWKPAIVVIGVNSTLFRGICGVGNRREKGGNCPLICLRVLTLMYRQVLSLAYWKTNGFPRNGFKMLNCQICAARVDVLAHQIRGSVEVAVCLDCADRYYQDQLTKTLIANEKVVA